MRILDRLMSYEILFTLFLLRNQIVLISESYGIYMVIIFGVVWNLIRYKKINKLFIYLNIIILFIFIFNMVFFSEYRIQIEEIINKYIVASFIGVYLFVNIDKQSDKLFDCIVKFSWLNILIVFILKNTKGLGYMDLGYFLLISAIAFYCKYKFDNKIIYGILSLFLNIYIFINGSRGAILSFCILIIFIEIYFLKENKTKKYIITMISKILISIIAIGFIVEGNIVRKTYNYLNSKGIYSYSFAKYLGNDNSFSSGRDRIYDEAIREIKQHPIIGNGIGSYQKKYQRLYIHNIALDILNEMGLIIFVIVVFLILRYIYEIFYGDVYDVKMLFIIMGLSLKLVVSSQYWSEVSFWLIIYISMNQIIYRKNEKISIINNRKNFNDKNC